MANNLANIVFLKILPQSTQKALEKLDASTFFKETASYLAGGTGLALHIGHRQSDDLDLFTSKKFRPAMLAPFIQKCGRFKLESTDWQTIVGTFENVKFCLFYYQYPLLDPLLKILTSTRVASLKDIAAMKVSAISQRATKRDFIDLYFLLKNFSLKEILEFYNSKFKNLAVNHIHILKSLSYFADAEDEPAPQLLNKTSWETVKATILREVQKIENFRSE